MMEALEWEATRRNNELKPPPTVLEQMKSGFESAEPDLNAKK